MSGESYIQHHLNVSKTKEAHLFPKEQRFQNKRRLYLANNLELQRPSIICPPLITNALLASASATKYHSLIPPSPLRLLVIICQVSFKKKISET